MSMIRTIQKPETALHENGRIVGWFGRAICRILLTAVTYLLCGTGAGVA